MRGRTCGGVVAQADHFVSGARLAASGSWVRCPRVKTIVVNAFLYRSSQPPKKSPVLPRAPTLKTEKHASHQLLFVFVLCKSHLLCRCDACLQESNTPNRIRGPHDRLRGDMLATPAALRDLGRCCCASRFTPRPFLALSWTLVERVRRRSQRAERAVKLVFVKRALLISPFEATSTACYKAPRSSPFLR